MNAEQLIEKANESFQSHGAGGFEKPSQSPERYFVTEVHTEFNGHSVRIEFVESESNPPSYKYNATVYDAETGEQIGTGNGASNWEEAFSIVHWSEMINHWV
ncbi:hypothetical protein GCM10022239_19130 [Leifsonia bigeumensis]|uniref:Uncharacterized protein n=1 Tax=Leifsonella bigeumensis TaxID=433643 RepID=A0ABP7FNX2_9MICO